MGSTPSPRSAKGPVIGKLKLSAKLYFTVIFLCVVIAATGVYGLNMLNAFKRNIISLHEDRVIPLEQLNIIRQSYTGDIIRSTDALNNNSLSPQKAILRFQNANQLIQRHWKEYNKTVLTPEEKILVDQTSVEMESCNAAISELTKALSTDPSVFLPSATGKTNAVHNAAENLARKLDKLINLQIKVSSELSRQAFESYHSAIRNFIILLACVLLFSIWLSMTMVGDTKRLFIALEESNKKIASSEAKSRAFIDNAGDAFLMLNESFMITDCNEKAEHLTGYSRAELLGMQNLNLIPNREVQNSEGKKEALLKGASTVHERTILKKDKTEIPTEISVTPVKNHGYIAILRDISERIKSLQKQNLLASIINFTQDSIVSETLQGVITSWNQGAQAIFGYSAEEIIGKHIWTIIPEDRHEEETEILEKIRKGEMTSHFRTQRRRKDGTLVDISLTVSPIKDATGSIIGASKIARDITSIVANEKAIQQSEKKYRYLFNNSPAFIFIWNLETLMVEEVNDAVVNYYGYNREEWARMSVFQYRPSEDEELIRAFAIKMLQSDAQIERKTWRHRHKNGKDLFMEIDSHKITYNNQPCILSLGRDITELKAQTDQNQVLARQLNSLIDNAEKSIIVLDTDSLKARNG